MTIAVNAPQETSEKGAELAGNKFKTPADKVLESYEQWADTYENDSLDKLGFTSPRICVEMLLKHTAVEDEKVLDVGAGTGLLAQMVEAQGKKAGAFDALDFSPKMLDHLVKKGIYSTVKAHDVACTPWPVESNVYDACICNGVLIYVEDPKCLEEFVRVTRKGGICVLMFRHDGYPTYKAKDMELRSAGKWELVQKTPDMRNFEKVDYGSDPEDDIIFNQWVYRVLVD